MVKRIFILSIIFCHSILLFSQNDKAYYNKFFPNPQKEIPFPIASQNNKQLYYTSYTDAMNFIQSLAEKYPTWISTGSIGKSQKGNDIPFINFCKKNNGVDTNKIRVAFIGCMHGNEPISTDGLLYLMNELTSNPAYESLLDNINLRIFPMVNVDGRNEDERVTNNGTDLNRDLTILSAPESYNIKNAINEFDPQVVVDFHEYAPDRKDFRALDKCFTASYDALFLRTGNLNVDPAISKTIENVFVNPAQKILSSYNRKVADYSIPADKEGEIILTVGGIASRSSATNYALQNRISLLMEIRGLSEKGNAAKRRIETDFLLATSYLKIAAQNAEAIKTTIKQANENAVAGKREIVVTSSSAKIKYAYTFVDKCHNEYTTVDFNALDNYAQTPEITRKRAEAYLILPPNEQVKKILKGSGVDFSEVTNNTVLPVTAYMQGNTKCELANKEINVPQGAIAINALQKTGNTIVDLLEPEGANSIISNKILGTNNNAEALPVYRITKSQMIVLTNKK